MSLGNLPRPDRTPDNRSRLRKSWDVDLGIGRYFCRSRTRVYDSGIHVHCTFVYPVWTYCDFIESNNAFYS